MPTRREFMGITAGVVGGLVVGAAGTLLVRPSTVSTTTTTEGGTGTVTKTVTAAQSSTGTANLADLGTLTVGINLSGGDTLDPAGTLDGDAVWIPINNAYQDFLQFHYPDFAYIGPMMLQSATQSSDGLSWTGTMTTGATFADGTPITSADLVYTIKRGISVQFATGLAGIYYNNIGLTSPSQITAPDANTIKITLPTPITPSLVTATLCSMPFGVVNQKIAEAHAVTTTQTITSSGATTTAGVSDGGLAWMNAGNSAGSGPFVLTEWVKDDHITMVANTNYWGTPKPKLSKVIFKHVATPEAELTLLQQGEVDVIWDPTPSQVAANQYTNGIVASENPQATSAMLWLNAKQPPFNQGSDGGVSIWQAVKAAIDYTGLINNVILGVGTNVQTLSWKGLYGYDASVPYQQNPAQVKQLLTAAGSPNGISFNMYYNTDDDIATLYAPKLQSDFKACGMTVQLQAVSGGQVITQLTSGNFQALTTWEGGGLQHIANIGWIELDPHYNYFPKWIGYDDPKADSLVAATTTAVGPAEDAALLAMTEYGLTNSPAISLFQKSQQILMSSAVVGLVVPFSRLNTDYGRVYKENGTNYS